MFDYPPTVWDTAGSIPLYIIWRTSKVEHTNLRTWDRFIALSVRNGMYVAVRFRYPWDPICRLNTYLSNLFLAPSWYAVFMAKLQDGNRWDENTSAEEFPKQTRGGKPETGEAVGPSFHPPKHLISVSADISRSSIYNIMDITSPQIAKTLSAPPSRIPPFRLGTVSVSRHLS